MPEFIRFDITDGVARLTLNRPDRLNALTRLMTVEILEAIATCHREEGVRCVVLAAAGRGFCAGQDLTEFQTLTGPETVGDHLRQGFNRIVLGLRRLEKPVIAQIQGVAAGAGLGLALAADLRIASEQARFTAAFIGIGLAPDTGVSWWLPRLVGPAKAFELLATNAVIDAAEALRLGLVNQVVPADRLETTVAELAGRLAQGPTRGIGLTKRVLQRALEVDLAAALEYEAQVQDIAYRTADHREGVAAFLEKRPPRFAGR
ncbi:MAG: enoyl-CoA hydratase-related protein [Anaerolineae bacterium]|nr:enoyl-CoA hydratase-related protein [Caldilineales bacterium]MDW8269443.1 enoyl-CoA hydratase-related protein [Anaerolineae bacterium]